MIAMPKFMEDETLYTITEEGIVLTEKGLKDPKVVKEYLTFIRDLIEYR